MKRVLLVLVVAGLALTGWTPGAMAQTDRPPTIFIFSSSVPAVTLADLETGSTITTLRWHIAHVDQSRHNVQLSAYTDNAWTLLNPARSLPPVGTIEVPLANPDFGPPMFRLAVTDPTGQRTFDERVVVIPYDEAAMADLTPTITAFTTTTARVDSASLAYGSVRITLNWQVKDRLPLTNLVFDQLLNEDGSQTQNVELPRDRLWVASSGMGVVAPVAPPDGSLIRLRLRVVDVISAEVYSEALLSVPVTGTPLPPEPSPTPKSIPPTTPAPTAGDLHILSGCPLATASANLPRGWTDSPGIPSPDSQYLVYSTNPVGDARLIIAKADGSGQVVIDAPNKGIPLGPRPRWSPDSTRVAFVNMALSQPGGGDIYVVKADGSDLVRVASYIGYYDDIAWSADGTQVYFTSGETQGSGSAMQVTNYMIYAVSADGFGTPTVITDGCGILQ